MHRRLISPCYTHSPVIKGCSNSFVRKKIVQDYRLHLWKMLLEHSVVSYKVITEAKILSVIVPA
jgi:hypothetical protein